MKAVRRLYTQFKPNSYDLLIDPDKANMTFKGQVTIRGTKTGRPSKRLVLHAKDLKIGRVSITAHTKNGDHAIQPQRVAIHKRYDELRLHAQDMIYPGEYTIEIEFSGRITRPMDGLYPCFYDNNGHEEIILATQFESHYARQVFPCIDEPEAKAVFNLSLMSSQDETVMANTAVSKQSSHSGRLKTVFEPTPKMSTYLLAFVIGKLDYLEGKTKHGVSVRTYAIPQLVKQTAFALDTAINCLDFYDDYFDIPYPLDHCFLVALPDFASGAMENWGLITFREQAMLVDDHETSLSMKQYVANVVAHELTHQWFGNLVTMRWWNDLWLNESFASLMSYRAVDHLHPEWHVWDDFIVEEQTTAFRLDSLENTHPINVEIHHPDEIRTIFDAISYEKGASVLYMLMRYLGETDFKNGLRIYLKKHAYNNSQSHDLWQAWEEAAAKPVADFMDRWTKQSGYPIIHADIQDKRISLHQSRFYLNPAAANKADTLWPVPLFASLDIGTELLVKAGYETKFKPGDEPIIINQGRSSFTRVVYNDSYISHIIKVIRDKTLNPLDRQGILADAFEAAKAGYGSSVAALDLLKAYSHEDSLYVWEVISTNIAHIRRVMDNDKLREAMNNFIADLAKERYEKLGWAKKPKESVFDTLARPLILGLMAASDDADIISHVKKLFKERAKHAIEADIRGVIYTTIARHGGKKEFDELKKMHNETLNSEEKISLAAGLTNFKQPELIAKSLDMIKSKDVRLQDAAYWISYSFSNRYAKQATWEWVKDNWDWLDKNLGSELSFYMMPRFVAGAFSRLEFLKEFNDFFDKHMSEGFRRSKDQAVETIIWQSAWRERDLNKLIKYFNAAS